MHLCGNICLAHFSVATEQQRDSCHLAEHFYGCNLPLFWGLFGSTYTTLCQLLWRFNCQAKKLPFHLRCRSAVVYASPQTTTARRQRGSRKGGNKEVEKCEVGQRRGMREESVSNTNRKSFEVHRSKWPRRQFSLLFVIIIIITVVVVVGVARAHWKLMSVRFCWFWPTGQASAAATTSASASSCLWP